MREADTFTKSLFTMLPLDDVVPTNHPLRPVRVIVNASMVKMDALLSNMCKAEIKSGRPGIAPEKLLRDMLLQIFYGIRSKRQPMEQTQYNMLFRWLIRLAMGDSVWVHTVFSKNRERAPKREGTAGSRSLSGATKKFPALWEDEEKRPIANNALTF